MSLTVTNHGTVNGPLSIRVNGPVNGLTLTQVVDGRTKTIAMPGLNLAEGDHVVIGSSEKQWVILNGTHRADNKLTSRQWMILEPGDNVFTLTDAASTDLSAQLVVTANSAW